MESTATSVPAMEPAGSETVDKLQTLLLANANRTRALFAATGAIKRRRLDAAVFPQEADELGRDAISLRLRAEYGNVRTLPPSLAAKLPTATPRHGRKKTARAQDTPTPAEERVRELIEEMPDAAPVVRPGEAGSSALVLLGGDAGRAGMQQQQQQRERELPANMSVVRKQDAVAAQPRPDWHPPWKLLRVISGHLGWVRALAVEPDNQWFASGAGDRTIKIWDLPTGRLKLTLTGHISTVRGLAVSPRHPYMFSCGEDKMVKCWDLEANKVIRHYHGHLSGVYTMALHPTLDLLVTGGRDGVARVWDMRTRANVHVLSGHTGTVSSLITQEADPQVITASLDSQVRLWDLVAGKTMGTLTHHKKGVRSVVAHPNEWTFASGSTNSIKQWKLPEGALMQNLDGHDAIVNTMAVNADGVLFSGADNGSMSFWDWKSGHRFQALDTIAQPGSLDAESGIMASTFDLTGMRLICGEADKTIKVWGPDPAATPRTHPLDWRPTMSSKF